MPTHSTSVSRAATWMAGWLMLMLVMAVAGRETRPSTHVSRSLKVAEIHRDVEFADGRDEA